MEGEGGGGGDDLMEFGERWVQRSELLAFEKGCILDTCAHGCETNPPSYYAVSLSSFSGIVRPRTNVVHLLLSLCFHLDAGLMFYITSEPPTRSPHIHHILFTGYAIPALSYFFLR